MQKKKTTKSSNDLSTYSPLESINVSEYEKLGFDNGQLHEIRYAIHYDKLRNEEISIFAKPEYTWQQMHELRMCVSAGLASAKIAVLSNPKFSDLQMEQMRLGFFAGLTIPEVSSYAYTYLDPKAMEHIRQEKVRALRSDPKR